MTGGPGPLPEGEDAGALDPEEPVAVTLVLRPRGDSRVPQAEDLGRVLPRLRAHLSRDQLAALRGAHPQDLGRVRDWAQAQGMSLSQMDPARRTVVLSGPQARLARLFGVELRRWQGPAGSARWARGEPQVPAGLAGAVGAVLGLDTRPRARPHFRPLPLPTPLPPLAQAAPLSYPPTEVAQLYQFPSQGSGAGQCVGLIELGGGFSSADVESYFQGLGVAVPELVAVSVDGASNQPTGNQDGPDGEVMLDIEVCGSVAPGVRLAVYFAPNTDQGFLDAIETALHDTDNKPSVISISWGSAEAEWSAATMTAFDEAFQDAALAGIAVCVAVGDQGSSDGISDGEAHVDFPASSPHVLACGGTRLTSSDGSITSEVTWNDGQQGGATGGGVSSQFPLPTWQDSADVPPSADPGHRTGRGIPDVAGDADPETGYRVLVDGQPAVFGGTSAVAPLWAGLLVLLAGLLGREPGYLNPMLYLELAAEGVTRDISKGNNGAYRAGPGWDACTGWGSPRGDQLLASLRQ